MTARLTPGHTAGCTTWTMQVQEDGQTLEAVIIGGTSVIADAILVNNTNYPRRTQDYEKAFAILKSLPVDLFLAAHGPFFGLSAKYDKLKSSGPNPFIDPTGYKTYLAAEEAAFLKDAERQQQIPTSTIPYSVSARGGLSSTSQGGSATRRWAMRAYSREQPAGRHPVWPSSVSVRATSWLVRPPCLHRA